MPKTPEEMRQTQAPVGCLDITAQPNAEWLGILGRSEPEPGILLLIRTLANRPERW
jgi:hypothetical protein